MMPPQAGLDPLPLFPLHSVLFPGGLLGLKVFEARYLDLVSECLRTRQPFGVICLRQGAEVGAPSVDAVQLEAVGTLAQIDEVDAEQPGILRLRCTGGQRFAVQGQASQRENGLWVARALPVAADPWRQPGPAMLRTVGALADAIAKLHEQGHVPFAMPYQMDDAGWVANRWCELLPLPLAAKYRLMALEDPVIRLSLVDGFLRDKKVVVG
jgi:Lon protease-like protein